MFFDRFFTNWALLCHYLFACGYFPNTFSIAVFVAAVSMISRFVVHQEHEGYETVRELGLHYVPFLLFYVKGVEWNTAPLVFVFTCYLAYHGFRMDRIARWYTKPLSYCFDLSMEELVDAAYMDSEKLERVLRHADGNWIL